MFSRILSRPINIERHPTFRLDLIIKLYEENFHENWICTCSHENVKGKRRDFAVLKFNLGFSLGSLATDIYQLHYT